MTSLPEIFTIKKIIDETPSVKTFFIKGKIGMQPGQFFMVWLPGVDEKPFTLSYTGKNPAVTIRRNGKSTEAFHKLKPGDKIGLRGPFGKGFTIHKHKKVAIVAGGIGMIALASLAEALPGSTIICGAKTKDEMIFHKRFRMHCCSDDGSIGPKCFSPQLFETMLKEKKFDFVYTCGPEIMIKAMLDLCLKYKIPMEASLERYMKCGIGVCASCVCGNKLICKDGPVFPDKELIKMDDFGKNALLMSGKKAALKEFCEWKQE
ncbi:MAG: dihydroorotate dehydrogenase electron transfer subunit [Nanoarchaeota archaeon]|nr:dihydroorotate dehydrogenase electron transfer subunit [Nanoarchaeota archaeon]